MSAARVVALLRNQYSHHIIITLFCFHCHTIALAAATSSRRPWVGSCVRGRRVRCPYGGTRSAAAFAPPPTLPLPLPLLLRLLPILPILHLSLSLPLSLLLRLSIPTSLLPPYRWHPCRHLRCWRTRRAPSSKRRSRRRLRRPLPRPRLFRHLRLSRRHHHLHHPCHRRHHLWSRRPLPTTPHHLAPLTAAASVST